MLDCDLANLYGVGTKVLNQAVRRNSERFPIDFMFQVSQAEEEAAGLAGPPTATPTLLRRQTPPPSREVVAPAEPPLGDGFQE